MRRLGRASAAPQTAPSSAYRDHEWWLSDLERMLGRSELDAASVAQARAGFKPAGMTQSQTVGGVGG